jgi:hypothetical protein
MSSISICIQVGSLEFNDRFAFTSLHIEKVQRRLSSEMPPLRCTKIVLSARNRRGINAIHRDRGHGLEVRELLATRINGEGNYCPKARRAFTQMALR